MPIRHMWLMIVCHKCGDAKKMYVVSVGLENGKICLLMPCPTCAVFHKVYMEVH